MVYLLGSLVMLVLGYVFYGRVIEKVFAPDPNRPTPAVRLRDGVDFVQLPAWKVFMIQFLNIAGLGPIFGAIMGAMFGPWAFVWIVCGCIFAGAVHDYFSGMISVREDGASISEIVGRYLGKTTRHFMRAFSVVLLVLVGVVFIAGPASLLATITPEPFGKTFWLVTIFAYYVLAVLLPIDQLIGRIYPLFGAVLLLMAMGLLGAMFVHVPQIPPLSFQNLHAKATTLPLFPVMFVVIACGAISGFHSTQSPIMARCIGNERLGRPIFFGAMIAEGALALIWAAAAIGYFGGVEGLNSAMAAHGNNAAWVVNEICHSWLGKTGAILAILGVVACPVTSGDTAFRSARLTIADVLKLPQKSMAKRLAISLPLFVVAFLLSQIDFGILWRYFSWSNQALATLVLWAAAAYLAKEGKNPWWAMMPALFMTVVSISYLAVAPEGFGLSKEVSLGLGAFAALTAAGVFLAKNSGRRLIQQGRAE